MTVASTPGKIDDLMEKASRSLSHMSYFEAERMAIKALGMARQEDDFERMARIVMPLLESRRQRAEQALSVGEVTVLDDEISEDMKIELGCYLVQPPLVGAAARRFRLAALHREVPVVVVCREPRTQLGLWPVVAIGAGGSLRTRVDREPRTQLGLWPVVAIGAGGSLRTRVDPPDDAEHPDPAWLLSALEELGDFAIQAIDPKRSPDRRIDKAIDYLDALPEHEGLHQYLEQACREAHKASIEDRPASPRRKKRKKKA